MRLLQPGDQVRILHFSRIACIVAVFYILSRERLRPGDDLQLVVLENDFLDFPCVHHLEELVVGDLLGRAVMKHIVEDAHDHQGDERHDQEDHQSGVVPVSARSLSRPVPAIPAVSAVPAGHIVPVVIIHLILHVKGFIYYINAHYINQ